MTPEQTEYYNNLEDMFTHPGWKILMEDAKAQVYQYQADALEIGTWDGVNILRGKAQQLAELVNLEAVTALQKQSLLEDDDANL